ncbi:MAG TPA: PIG-L family deacetylase [Gemmatimonadaceae bacterium]|nr:PIG-L family deacetylase [Gemmatimonadaceae bacterium]
MKRLLIALAMLPLLAAPRSSCLAQERGAAALGPLVDGLGVSARVLVIAAHPDDEDTRLIAWLARGRHVETAYLSLTRGDGGQNLIGNELGEALGAVRTEELLAARRIDGARQYFTRAYDFGFSKSAEETFEHWPRDSVLGDVVKVVRAFRPHVIVAIFSGTPRDGHGHHQVSGILAREAYDVSGDTARFPTAAYGPAWSVPKFYRATSYRNNEGATLRYNAGEYDPVLGRSYAELAGESRSQHKSQAFGVLQRKGVVIGSVRREATRVNAGTDADAERSLFDGIDTTWARARQALGCGRRAMALDSLAGAIGQAQKGLDLQRPEQDVPRLARVASILARTDIEVLTANGSLAGCTARDAGDARLSITLGADRARDALLAASGVAVEATVERDVVATGDSIPVTVTIYNRGHVPLPVEGVSIVDPAMLEAGAVEEADEPARATIAPDSAFKVVRWAHAGTKVTQPWWLAKPREGDLFTVPVNGAPEEKQGLSFASIVTLRLGGVPVAMRVPVTNRFADPVRGEVERPLAVVPAVSVTLDRTIELAPANAPIDRLFRVRLRSGSVGAREVTVSLQLPPGLVADSSSRRVELPDIDATREVEFRVRGKLPVGRHAVTALASSGGELFAMGYVPVEYEHIRPLQLYRPATVQLEAIDARVPPRVSVAYIPGVGDNVAPMLEQLGVPLTVIEARDLSRADLSRYTTIVVGPRAYEAHDELVAANARLLDWVRRGGTMVVQYGQYEMMRPGIMPYPITLARPAERVTDETAPIRVLQPGHPLLTTPNRISQRDFEGWVQERSTYMPSSFAPAYRPLFSTNDPGAPPNSGALLVAAYGKGTYVYATLAFFRQLPAGVPGAARLFLNLLGAHADAAAQVRP